MKLYKHQQELIDKNPKRWLLAWGCGSGKSLTALILAEKDSEPSDKKLLIYPKSLKDNWLEKTILPNSVAPDSWLMYSKEEFRKNWNLIEPVKAIVVDEAHFFSGLKSQMTKSLLSYLKKNPDCKIHLLTATPYMSSVWSIYTLGIILGKDWKWYQWNNTFFNRIKMGNRVVPVQKDKVNGRPVKELMAEAIKTIGNTVALDDVFDVPDQQFITEYFNLTKEQALAIENLTDLGIVRWTKAHQICGGTQKSDWYVPDAYYKSEKLERLKELLLEHKRAIVVCRYNNELEYIKQQLGRGEIINGDTKNKHDIISSANDSDECLLLVQASMSEGWEAPNIPTMIFYSYDFSLKNYVQICGRIQRANNIKKNIYISLVVKNTIDNDVYKCIQKKEDFHVELYK